MVSSSCPTPRWLNVSHCNGISTRWAAVRASVVKMPSVGGQSSTMSSYALSSGLSADFSSCSRPVRISSICSAAASSIVAGSRSGPSSVGRMASLAATSPSSTWCTERSRVSGS